jgi:pimeloyl-ACP methyl ester carboxylesterase
MLKRGLKILAGILVVAVVVSVGLGIGFALWLDDQEERLESGSRVAATPRGEIEYAITGTGTPVLRIHGTPGGYDQSIAGALSRPESIAGFKVIAISRPGYLRTPLSSGKAVAEQADLYAALLDELKIERAIIFGVSGGGPSALQFALRHPRRTVGLVLLVPHLRADPSYAGRMAPSSVLAMRAQDFGIWIGTTLMSERLAGIVLPSMMPEFDATDPVQLAMTREIGRGFIPANRRAAGRANDTAQYRDLEIGAWPLEAVSVPTLILHGTKDSNAPYEASKLAATRIPDAELVTFEGTDHLMIITRHREVSGRIMPFMQALAKGEAAKATRPPGGTAASARE